MVVWCLWSLMDMFLFLFQQWFHPRPLEGTFLECCCFLFVMYSMSWMLLICFMGWFILLLCVYECKNIILVLSNDNTVNQSYYMIQLVVAVMISYQVAKTQIWKNVLECNKCWNIVHNIIDTLDTQALQTDSITQRITKFKCQK